MGKKVRCSNLMVRFYTADGWTKEELDACIEGEGEFRIMFPNDNLTYYTLAGYSRYNVEKIASLISEVSAVYADYQRMDKKELLEMLNG